MIIKLRDIVCMYMDGRERVDFIELVSYVSEVMSTKYSKVKKMILEEFTKQELEQMGVVL